MDVHIYDNGGTTFDRYTAIFPEGGALVIGPTGNVPNGVCMHVDGAWVPNDGPEVPFDSLPEPVQAAIRDEWHTWYRPGATGMS